MDPRNKPKDTVRTVRTVPGVRTVLLVPMVLSAILILGVTNAAAQSNPPEPPVVVASGEGVVKAAPDQAWVRIGAENRSKNPTDAQQQNAQAMSAVQQNLAALGIAKDAITTVAIDLQIEYDYANGRQTPRGYVARNTIEVRVDELSRLGEVLDAAVGSGATLLHGLRFDLKNRETLERSMARQDSSTPVSAGEIEIRAQVRVTASLK